MGYHVLLCCGAGMSSGFLAQRARQNAKKRSIHIILEARAESEVKNYLSYIDILLIGPHYAHKLNEFKEMCQPFNVRVALIPNDVYSTLNGQAVIDLVLEKMEDKI